jgi:hypothetical protein
MKAPGGRGGIAPTHPQPRHFMGVSGQHHVPAALYPRGKDPRYPLECYWIVNKYLKINCLLQVWLFTNSDSAVPLFLVRITEVSLHLRFRYC